MLAALKCADFLTSILVKPMSKNTSGRADAADLDAFASPTLFTISVEWNQSSYPAFVFKKGGTRLTHPWNTEIVVHLTSPSRVNLTVPRSKLVVSATGRRIEGAVQRLKHTSYIGIC